MSFEAYEMPEEIHPESIGCVGEFDGEVCVLCECLKQCHAPPDDVMASAWKLAFNVTTLNTALDSAGFLSWSVIQVNIKDPSEGFVCRLVGEPFDDAEEANADYWSATQDGAIAFAAKSLRMCETSPGFHRETE
jgi:hypothetical protein